jgi:hypothetical protein
MNACLAHACGGLLGGALLAACSLAGSIAHAQQRDEAWVISQVTAGKFEELRTLEKLSDEGVPFAMYWWGSLLQLCVFDRCDAEAGRALFLRAAQGGHGRAQAVLFAAASWESVVFGDARSQPKLAALTAEIGMPKDAYPRLMHALSSLRAAGLRHKADPKVVASFVAHATSERQLALLAELVELEGMSKRADELRVVADSGYVGASERVIQWEVIVRTTDAQMLERARAGELWLAAAYCDMRAKERGEPVLPADTLPVCERAAAQGFPGAVVALLRHHHHSKNHRAAEYFAGACEALLAIRCAEDIAKYYDDRRDESADLRAKWELWDLADALDSNLFEGVTEVDVRGQSERLRRGVYLLIVRTLLIDETCLTQRLDPATGVIESNPQCPWRKPIAIPAEFLSGAK